MNLTQQTILGAIGKLSLLIVLVPVVLWLIGKGINKALDSILK